MCKPEFKRYKDKRKRSDECLILQKDEASGKVTVSNITNSLSKQHTFLSQGQRCDCNECITEETQCSHEIRFWCGFHPSLYGLEDLSFTNILLSGNAMNQVITCVPQSIKLKPKYLYDWTKKMAKHFTLSQAGDMM